MVARIVGVAFVAVTALVACSSNDCADCGPCGIAGPLLEDTLAVTELGGGVNAEPTARIGVLAKGTCRGGTATAKWEVRLVAPPQVSTIADPSALAPLTGTKESGGIRLADGSLIASTVQSPSSIRFTYTGVASGPSDGGTNTRNVTCTSPVNLSCN